MQDQAGHFEVAGFILRCSRSRQNSNLRNESIPQNANLILEP